MTINSNLKRGNSYKLKKQMFINPNPKCRYSYRLKKRVYPQSISCSNLLW